MPTDPQHIQNLFLQLVELPRADRTAALDRKCGPDAELRRRVRALLQAQDEPDSHLDQPRGNPPDGNVALTLDSGVMAAESAETGEHTPNPNGKRDSRAPQTATTYYRRDAGINPTARRRSVNRHQEMTAAGPMNAYRTLPLLVVSMGLFAAAASAADTLAGLPKLQLTVDGVDRVVRVRLPPGAKVNPAPIVFAFHGHGGTMENAVRDFAIHKHWTDAIVVYPQGLPSAAPNDPQGEESGWQYEPGDHDDRDVALFDAVLEDLRQKCKIDDKRIYAVGFSNGGGFAYVLWSVRGDQISAVVSCAMKPRAHMISTLKPMPFLQIAGRADETQRLADQEKTVMTIAEMNECGEGRPWRKNANCTIYPSKVAAPVVFMIHPGRHVVPKAAPATIVAFLRDELQSVRRANPAVGDWHLNQPSVGESDLHITETAGKLQVQEIGRGNAKSTTATCKDGLLVIHWHVHEGLRGYWVLDLNEEYSKGTGKSVFLRFEGFGPGSEPGEAREIEGRKVRVVEGVTIERADPSGP